MTLKKLIESTTAASNRSWITQSITFIAGWWKSLPMGTPTPSATADTPEDEAAQKELSDLARALHNGTTGSYEKLSAFAVKNTTNVWGARAALALGYDDYSKNRTARGFGWLIKAQNDALLREYALY